MAEKPPLRHEEVRRILAALEPLSEEGRIVLVGGQAVAFWAAFLRRHSQASLPVVASKDIDFEGARQSVRRAGDLLGGKVHIPSMDHHTPNTGIVLFVDSQGIEREIDFIGSPLGLEASDVRKTAVRLLFPRRTGAKGEFTVQIMHPERSMESRIYNAAILGKTDQLALRQLRVAITCAREWSRFLLDQRARANRRAVLNINERIFRRCVRNMHFRKVHADQEVDPFEAVLLDDRLGKAFRELRYPQMVEALERRRSRDRAA